MTPAPNTTKRHHRKDNGDVAAQAGSYHAPRRLSYPVNIPREYDSAPPIVRKTPIRQNIVEPLKNNDPGRYRQALAAFCSEYPDDATCGPQVGLDTVLDTLGLIPGVGSVVDVLHGASYIARGKYGEGAAYLGFLIPEAGDVAQEGKIAHDLRTAEKACNSFVPGTQVLMADGTHKPIEKVKVGDEVVAADPQTGKTRIEPVIASFGGTRYNNLIKITVDIDGKRGQKTGVIIATEHHVFWNPTEHAWTRADHLVRGTELRTPSGSTVRVERAVHYPGHPVVRDLTVADLHTFFVEADSMPVLVHNCPMMRDSKTLRDLNHRARLKG